MKYAVVHLIRGEAKKAQEAITKDLAEKLDVYPLHKFAPPHLTLKRSFEMDENKIQFVYETLDSFAAAHSPSNYQLKGFGHFNEVAVYIAATASREMKQDVCVISRRRFQRFLESPWTSLTEIRNFTPRSPSGN